MSDINIDGRSLDSLTAYNFQTVGSSSISTSIDLPYEPAETITIVGSIATPSQMITVNSIESTNQSLLYSGTDRVNAQDLWSDVVISLTDDDGITREETVNITTVPNEQANEIIIDTQIYSSDIEDITHHDSIELSGTGTLKRIGEAQYRIVVDDMSTTNINANWNEDFTDFFVNQNNGNGTQTFGFTIPQYNTGAVLQNDQSDNITGIEYYQHSTDIAHYFIHHTADSLIHGIIDFGGDYGMGEGDPEVTTDWFGGIASIKATYNSDLTDRTVAFYSNNNNVKVDLVTGNPFETQNLQIWQGEEENPSIEIENLTPTYADDSKFTIQEDLSDHFPFEILELSSGKFQTTVEYPNGMPEFPTEEYGGGTPTLYENFTDMSGNVWQWQWLTNGQYYGGGVNADNLTSPPQYAWWLVTIGDGVERTYRGWFTTYYDSNDGSNYYDWYGTSLNGENMPNRQYRIEVPGIDGTEIFQGVVQNWGEDDPGTTLDMWFSFEIPSEGQYNNVQNTSVHSNISYRLAPPISDEYIVNWSQTITTTFTPQIDELPINFSSYGMISSSLEDLIDANIDVNFQITKPAMEEQISTFSVVNHPWQGREIYIDHDDDNLSYENDNRFPLGTYTENNRDFWEQNTFDAEKLESNIKDVDLQMVDSFEREWSTYPAIFGDEEKLVEPDITANYSTRPEGVRDRMLETFSVDAFAYTKKETLDGDKLYPLCFYYDKKLHEEEYKATSDNKVYLKIIKRTSGRGDIQSDLNNYVGYHNPFANRHPLEAPFDVTAATKLYFITQHNFNLEYGVFTGKIDLSWTVMPSDVFKWEYETIGVGTRYNWDIDVAQQVSYKLYVAEYLSEYIGYGDYQYIGTVNGGVNTFTFDTTFDEYKFNTNYKFAIRAVVESPNTNQGTLFYPGSDSYVESMVGVDSGDEYVGLGLVRVILSSTRDDNIAPPEGTELILSAPDSDDDYPSQVSISAISESGYEFTGWEIQPPHANTDAIIIDNLYDLGTTTIQWANDANGESEDILNLTLHANYIPVSEDYGNPVEVTVYGGSGGEVNVPGVSQNGDGVYVFTMTHSDQIQMIQAFPDDGKEFVRWSVENWTGMEDSNDDNEIGIVGFGPHYLRYEIYDDPELKWNNGGNYDDGTASVRAIFADGGNDGGGKRPGDGDDDALERTESLINTELGQGN